MIGAQGRILKRIAEPHPRGGKLAKWRALCDDGSKERTGKRPPAV
jgi:hypothetical protein